MRAYVRPLTRPRITTLSGISKSMTGSVNVIDTSDPPGRLLARPSPPRVFSTLYSASVGERRGGRAECLDDEERDVGQELTIGIAVPDLSEYVALDPSWSIGDPEQQCTAAVERCRDDGRIPIHGRDVRLVFASYRSNQPAEKVAAARRLAEDDAVRRAGRARLHRRRAAAGGGRGAGDRRQRRAERHARRRTRRGCSHCGRPRTCCTGPSSRGRTPGVTSTGG